MTDQRTDAIVFSINGQTRCVAATWADDSLLWVLREQFGLKGTKFGCGHGQCGACMVQIDGLAVPSCTISLKDVSEKHVVTIEGIAASPESRLLSAWVAEQVPQCGYCQPGMVVTADALLSRTPRPTDGDIDEAMSSVLCRCGTYRRARRAIHRASNMGEDFSLPVLARAETPAGDSGDDGVTFNPWIRIASNGIVIVLIGQAEMGQGITTALSLLVAEELDVPLERVRTEFAPESPAYINPLLHIQITVGSLSIKTNWERMRRAGAEVRERLVLAAARRWNAEPDACRTERGEVVHAATGRRIAYADIAKAAAALPPPEHPHVKSAGAFTLLGKYNPRLDAFSHATGRTIFGLDVDVPGKLVATVVMPPVLGAEIAAVYDAQAKAVEGVRAVKRISGGIAVVAENFPAAQKGREALTVVWRGGLNELDSATILKRFHQAAGRDGKTISVKGDVELALREARETIEAKYETPFQAHAPIEPMNCTARVSGSQCDVWVPTQSPTLARRAAADAAGLALDRVTIHNTNLGGGFGRRTVPDIVTQAVEIAKSVDNPVQLLWTRSDDMQHDRYRPAGLAIMRGALTSRGTLAAWFQRVIGAELVGEGLDIAYDVPALRTKHVLEDVGVPTGYWRSVGASQHAFAVECFMDELALAGRCDPVVFRQKHLKKAPRHCRVLELAAEMAGWGSAPPKGRSRGVAVYSAHGGWAAQIAEISVFAEQKIKVHRIVCAVDCGFVVNPDTAKAQIEGAIVFGLTAALKTAITIKDGRVRQTGFGDFPILTMAETPEIDVHFVASQEPPSGAGECGVPPVAPAVANAIFAATGRRLRSLPLSLVV